MVEFNDITKNPEVSFTFDGEFGSFSTCAEADTKVASANRSTTGELLSGFPGGTRVGASMRSPIKLSPKRSTFLGLGAAASAKKFNSE